MIITQNFFFDSWGKELITSVHYGVKFEGAKWLDFLNPPQLVCGDGDLINWGPACNSLDIVAHELTHGLIQLSGVELNPFSQSGAIEESICDVFAIMIDNKNWTIGEGIYMPNDKGRYYRSIKSPPSGAKVFCSESISYSQPEHMSQYVNTSCNKYGVHINSGILNKAAYYIISKIGREKSAKIYYYSIPYLTLYTDFVQYKSILLQTCHDIFSFESKECTVVLNAFQKVGLG